MKPMVGDIVHFVLDSGANRSQCRPAIIVKVTDPRLEKVRAAIVLDSPEDEPPHSGHEKLRGLHHDQLGRPGTWHAKHECPATPPEWKAG